MIDSMKFRKLENGYTVRYHVPSTAQMAGNVGPSGFVRELYVTDKAGLIKAVGELIATWLERDPEPKAIATPLERGPGSKEEVKA